MSTNPDILPPDRPAPRKGERAAQIRKLALRYPELSNSEIARKVGCRPQNVSGVLSTFLAGHSEEKLRDYQQNRADIFDAVGMRALSSITDDTLAKAGFQQLVTGAAILVDKSQLLRGQPTSIHVSALLDVLDVIRERDESK